MRGNGKRGPFLGRQKQHLSAYSRNTFLIDYDDENYEYDVDNFDVYDDNDQNPSTTMTMWLKYTPFKYYYLVKKNQLGI